MQVIQLDISKKTEIPTIEAKQDDVGRKFQAVILEDGKPFLIPQDVVITLWYSGAAGEGNYTQINGKSPFHAYENKVTVEMISQMLRLPGGGQMCLVMLDRSGRQIGFWNIPYHVEKIPGMGSEGAENYFSAMTEMLQDLQTDKSLTFADKPADAKAVGDALRRVGLGDGLLTDGGAVSNLEQLSQLVYTTLGNMPVPSSLELSVLCDFDHSSSMGKLTVYKAMGMDSAHEATAMLVTAYGDILIGTSWDDSLEGQWLPIEWAWSNPPMEEDVEYRTTERHMGNPVYTKLVFFGELPNGACSYLMHGIALTQVIRCSAYVDGGESIPAISNNNNISVTAYCNHQHIAMETKTDMSHQTAHAQIWYTKD